MTQFGNLIHFTDETLATMRSFAQRSPEDLEAGGQLFARFEDGHAYIEVATGPKPEDKRTRFGFVPDHEVAKREVLDFYERGLHWVGDWHTHAEPHPTPSDIDSASFLEMFRVSTHELFAMVMAIQGTESLYVAMVNTEIIPLKATA